MSKCIKSISNPKLKLEEKKDDARDLATAKARRILKEHQPEMLDPTLSAEMESIIKLVEKT